MELDIRKIQDIVEKGDKRGIELLSILNKQRKFAEALNSEIGKLLMNDAVLRADEILHKIVEEKSTVAERAEYRALKRILSDWSGHINSYLCNLEKVAKGER